MRNKVGFNREKKRVKEVLEKERERERVEMIIHANLRIYGE